MEERSDRGGIPLIILGGANAQSAFIVCASSHGKGESLVDALYFGEAEVFWKDALVFISDAKSRGLGKPEMLRGLKREIPALHIPLPETGESGNDSEIGKAEARCNAIMSDVSGVRSLFVGPVWYDEESVGYSNVATDYGCPFLCRFCKEAWEKRPYRSRQKESIIKDIISAKQYMGLDTVNLFSFNFTSNREAEAILEQASKITRFVQIKSQRFDGLIDKPLVYSHLAAIGKTSFTFGLEGVSSRIRRYLRKGIDEEDVLDALGLVLGGAVRQVKVFLIVCGFEDDDDLLELDTLIEKMTRIRNNSRNRGASIIFSVTPLIPMPHTPLQFAPFQSEPQYKAVMKKITLIAEKLGMMVRESVSFEEAQAAALLLFSDADKSDCIARDKIDHLYDQAMPRHAIKSFRTCVSPLKEGYPLSEKDAATAFPWDRLYSVDEKQKLYESYIEAKAELEERNPSSHLKQNTSSADKDDKSREMQRLLGDPARKKEEVFLFRFGLETDERHAGLPMRFFQVALARGLMIANPGLVLPYSRPSRSVPDVLSLPTFGAAHVLLEFRENTRELLSEAVARLGPDFGFLVHWADSEMPLPEYSLALIEYEADQDWTDQFIYDVLNEMNGESVSYDILKNDGKKTAVITKQSVKKAGYRSIVWDLEKKKLSMPLDVTVRALRRVGGSSLSRLWKKSGKAFRVVRWITREIKGSCSLCGSGLLSEALDWRFEKSTVCIGCLHEVKN